MSDIRCQCCGKWLQKGGLKYVLEIKSFADFDGYLEEYPGDIDEGINELLDAIESVAPETLEEDVFLERIYILCKDCRDRFIEDPFQTGDLMDVKPVLKGTVH